MHVGKKRGGRTPEARELNVYQSDLLGHECVFVVPTPLGDGRRTHVPRSALTLLSDFIEWTADGKRAFYALATKHNLELAAEARAQVAAKASATDFSARPSVASSDPQNKTEFQQPATQQNSVVDSNEILSYTEMCAREDENLQRGMHFRAGSGHSILLMSRRVNAPYSDQILDGGSVLIYEGHDVPQSTRHPYPKQIDQPEALSSGELTENGAFFYAATSYKANRSVARSVRVYEKIKTGIWAYNGLFHLVDAWREASNGRQVFKFKLVAVEANAPDETRSSPHVPAQHRLIPTAVKLEVWKRDQGKCTRCGSGNDLHFDHIIPFSRGGSSTTAANIQLLCGRHNLEKHDHIQ